MAVFFLCLAVLYGLSGLFAFIIILKNNPADKRDNYIMKIPKKLAMFAFDERPKIYTDNEIEDTLKRIGFNKNLNQYYVVKSIKYIINDYESLTFNEKNELEFLIKRKIETLGYRGIIEVIEKF